MKLFILQEVEDATDSYHTEGGLAIVAADLEAAQLLIAGRENTNVTPDEWEKVVVYDVQSTAEPRVFVFPNTGCC